LGWWHRRRRWRKTLRWNISRTSTRRRRCRRKYPATIANSGGGGGGADENGTGGSGAAGVVIVRYPNAFADATATTGSPTFTNTGGYKIYKWTGNGSITI
jgi:hypothetical protein